MHSAFKGKYDKDEKKKSSRRNEDGTEHNKKIRLKEHIRPEERDILLKTVPLSDGKHGDMVSCYKVGRVWHYVCNICNVGGDPWKPFLQHLQGKKHEENFGKPYHNFIHMDESNVSRRKRARSLLRENNNRDKHRMSTIIDPPQVAQNNRDTQNYDRKVFNKDSQNPGNHGYNRKSTSNFSSSEYGRLDNFHIQKEKEHVPRKTVEPLSTYTRFQEEEGRFYEYIQSVDNMDLWQKYQEGVKIIEVNLLEELKYYQETPWKHPKYDKERIAYHKRRNEELILMNEDPRNYDIKVEWDLFWDIRLNELFKEIFEQEKAQLRQKLQYSLTLDKTSQSDEVGYRNCELNKRGFNHGNRDKKLLSDGFGDFSEQTMLRPVIPVLRKLSVLEQNLGSLGPKVIDLLSTALTLEKSCKNGSFAIMSSKENCILLETVMEKLKGFLQSGLLSEAMVTLTESAVHSINELLSSYAEGEKLSLPIESKSPSQNINKLSSLEQLSDLKRQGSYFDKQKTFPGDRRSYSTEQLSRSIERSSQFSGKISCSDDRNYQLNELSPKICERNSHYSYKRNLSEQRSSRRNEKRLRSKERSFSRERCFSRKEIRPNSTERQKLFEINSPSREKITHKRERELHPNERDLRESQRHIYNDAAQIFDKEIFIPDRISQNQNLSASRNIRVSEIIIYIENLSILSHLTILQRTAISQQIASLLLLRGIVEITEDELLLLIKTIIPNSAQSNLLSSQIKSPYGDQFFSTNTFGRKLPDRKPEKIPNLKEVSRLPPNRNIYSSLEQNNNTFTGCGSRNMAFSPSQMTKYSVHDNVTYPLNSKSYSAIGYSN